MAGSIQKVGKKYRVIFELGKDVYGKRLRKSITVPAYVEARKILSDFEDNQQRLDFVLMPGSFKYRRKINRRRKCETAGSIQKVGNKFKVTLEWNDFLRKRVRKCKTVSSLHEAEKMLRFFSKISDLSSINPYPRDRFVIYEMPRNFICVRKLQKAIALMSNNSTT